MNQKQALAKNTAFQIAGKSFATIFGLITVGVLTRYLGPEDYGRFTTVITFLSIFAVIVDFGLTLTTTQLISEDEKNEERYIGNLITLRLISAIIFLSSAPFIGVFFPYDHIMLAAIAIGAFSYLFGTTSQMMIGIFQKRLAIGKAVFAELINRGFVLVGSIAAVLAGFGLLGIMWVLVIGNALQLISMLLFASKYIKIKLKLEWKIWKKIISRSWPIGASIFFNLIYLRGDIIFMSWYRPLTEIGIYGTAYKVIDVVTMIPVMFMGLLVPLLVAAWSNNRKSEFNKHLQDTFDFFAILAIPLSFGAFAIGVPLMELIGGSEFTDSGRVLALLAPAASLAFFGALFGHAIVGINKQKPMTWGYLFVAILTIFGYIKFIPEYGMWAAAWWTLISEGLIMLLTFAVVKMYTKYQINWRLFLRATLASIIMYIGLIIGSSIHVILLFILGSLVYFAALGLLGGPKLKDMKNLFLPDKPPITP